MLSVRRLLRKLHVRPASAQGTYPSDSTIATMHDTVPNYAASPTVLSVQSGNWSDSATWSTNAVPTDDDIVGICVEHAVTYDVDSSAVLKAVGIAGTLQAAANTDLQMIVQHFYLYGPPTLGAGNYAYLELGTVASPINAANTVTFITPDVALEAGDTNQYGNGFHIFGKIRASGAVKTPFVRNQSHVASSATSLTLASAPSGWRSGDRVLIPDSRPFIDPAGMKPFQDEVCTLSGAPSGTSATISATSHAHPAWKDDDGSTDPDWTAHVANLTRNVIFKSENADPTHARGHFMLHGRADVDIRYVRFDSLGRTRWDSQVGPSNGKGRYIHCHHLLGPTSIPASGYQYVILGCVMEEMASSYASKWGLVLHDSHYGLIQGNIIYRYGGSSLYSEQGNESFNVIDGNLFCKSPGDGGRGDAQYNGANPGTEGQGLWLAGMNNYVRNNVSCNHEVACYGIYNGDFPESVGGHQTAHIPAFQGADPDDDYVYPAHDNVPLLEFLNNEGYTCDVGLNQWFIGTVSFSFYTAVEADVAQSVIEGYRSWNCKRGTFFYPSAGFKFLNCSFRVSFDQLQYSIGSYGILPVDYMQRDQILEGCEFLGCRIGVGVPSKVGDSRDANSSSQGEYLIKDCTFQCLLDVYAIVFNAVTGGGDAEAPRKITIDNPTFLPVTSNTNGVSRVYYYYDFLTDNGSYPHYNWVLLDQTFITNYGGHDYQIFAAAQAGSYVTPQTGSGNVGSPDSGKTNTQNLADNGVCVRGEITPGGTTTLANIDGDCLEIA